MPGWLRIISHINPLTYEVDALRTLMLAYGVSSFGLILDFGVLGAAVVILMILSARLYPNIVA